MEPIFLISIAILLFYFLPAIIGSNRKHNNALPIFLVNLFFGWTFLGWMIALIWASTNNTQK